MPESFHGSSLPDVMKKVRANLGPDAMILRTAVRAGRGGDIVEIVAAPAAEVESLRSRLKGPAPRPRETGKDGARPESYRIAFVGPGGAGKTTALVKLALAAASAPDRRPRPVGILTLDTWRAGALEELTTWADVLGVPLEVVDSVAEIPHALESLNRCDVILIDTPGCGHGTPAARRSWWPILEALRPHEVHAAVPAAWRTDVARATVRALEGVRPTHLLVTQVDAAPGDRAMMEMVRTLDMPVRWVTDSPEHSVVVKPAGSRILTSLEVERKGSRSPAAQAAAGTGGAAPATPRGAPAAPAGTYGPGSRTAAAARDTGSGASAAAPAPAPPAQPAPRPADEPRIPLPNVYPFTRAG
jgi:flagellar biosynthesis GTPase FlhF